MAIVLLGEGDFSFASSFEEPVWATTYESREATMKSYPHLQTRLDCIRASGSKILFDVDARKVAADGRLPQAKLCRWNCPCPGWGGSMQTVLGQFFDSVKSTLTPEGCVEILYTRGQNHTVMKDLCLAACKHSFSAPKGRPFEPVKGYVAKYCDSDEPLDMVGATIWSVQYLGEGGERFFPALPAGVVKRTVVPANSEEWLRPSLGDRVTVRVAKAGSALASAPSTTFDLGSTPLPGCLLQCISSMRTGETSQFTLPLQNDGPFEVELVAWVKREDLFGDGGAIKTILEHGDCWEWMPPERGYEVSMTIRVVNAEGAVLRDHSKIVYVVGSGSLPGISRDVVDRALIGMRRKERASVRCAGSYAPVIDDQKLEGAKLDITLHEWRMVVDVSPSKDGSLLAKLRRCERTWLTPKPTEMVRVVVDEVMADDAPLAGFRAPRALEDVTISDPQFCEGMRRVLAAMKLGENAIVECSRPALFLDERLGISPGDASTLVARVQLLKRKADAAATEVPLAEEAPSAKKSRSEYWSKPY